MNKKIFGLLLFLLVLSGANNLFAGKFKIYIKNSGIYSKYDKVRIEYEVVRQNERHEYTENQGGLGPGAEIWLDPDQQNDRALKETKETDTVNIKKIEVFGKNNLGDIIATWSSPNYVRINHGTVFKITEVLSANLKKK